MEGWIVKVGGAKGGGIQPCHLPFPSHHGPTRPTGGRTEPSRAICWADRPSVPFTVSFSRVPTVGPIGPVSQEPIIINRHITIRFCEGTCCIVRLHFSWGERITWKPTKDAEGRRGQQRVARTVLRRCMPGSDTSGHAGPGHHVRQSRSRSTPSARALFPPLLGLL